MRGFIAGLGLLGVVAACSSTSPGVSGGDAPDPDAGLGSDASDKPRAFELGLAADAAVVTGQSVTIPVTITRRIAGTGPSTLEVQGLGGGLRADVVTIAPTDATVNLVIVAEPGAKQGLQKPSVVARNAAGNDAVTRPLDLLVRGPSGSLDPTWGSEGIAEIPAGLDVVAMTLTASRALTVAGNLQASAPPRKPTLLRLTEAGALDPAFNGGTPLALPSASPGVSALSTDEAGAGSVVYDSASGSTVRFVFDAAGRPDTSRGAEGLQLMDAGKGAATSAVDPQGYWYTRSGGVLRRYSPAGTPDLTFAPPALNDNFPEALVAGGQGLLLVLSASNGSKVWRVDGSKVTSLGVSPRAAAIDAANNVYIADASSVIRRYRTDLDDLDPAFEPPATGDLSNLVGIGMTAFDDALFVHGGTADNTGGPVPSTTILRKYGRDGSAAVAFGQGGAAASQSGRFVAAKLVKTKDGRLYVARKLTDDSGRRSILRYWD